MDYVTQRFSLAIQMSFLLFKDLELILILAKQTIDKEKLTAPFLTEAMLDNYINIAKKYHLFFAGLNDKKIEEIDLNNIMGWVAGFGRSFENPLANSENWTDEITLIRCELDHQMKKIIDFLANKAIVGF